MTSQRSLWFRIVSLVVPRARRADWRREWSAELAARNRELGEWQSPRAEKALHEAKAGMFRDAAWLRFESLRDAVNPLLIQRKSINEGVRPTSFASCSKIKRVRFHDACCGLAQSVSCRRERSVLFFAAGNRKYRRGLLGLTAQLSHHICRIC